MSTIIICLICVALAFGVEYFERRHMRLFKLKAEHQSGENVGFAVDQVYYGGKAKDKSEAERLRTRKIKYVFWALIIFLGVASIVFVNFKDQWLGEWKSFFSSENKVEVKAPITKADDYSLSVWDYLAAQFSYEKAYRYYGIKKVLAYREVLAECQKLEEELKQEAKDSNEVENFLKSARLKECKAELDIAQQNLQNFDVFMYDWKLYLKLNWLILALLLIGGADLYFTLKGDKKNKGDKAENIWSDCCAVLSIIVAFVGVFWPFILWVHEYQCGMIFTFKDVIGIILTVWCFVFFVEHASELD